MQNIKKRLTGLPDKKDAFALENLFFNLFNTQTLTSATLTGGASATVTTGAAITAIVNGVLVTKATGASLAALNGPNVANTGSTFQAWIFTMDSAGTFYTLPGVPAATLAGVQLPTVYEVANGSGQSGLPQVVVGMLTMNNASVGAFVPATTLLNVSNLNVVFTNITGPFFPVQTI
jgi:hypothetical protein